MSQVIGLIPNANVRSYPDVAITLDYSVEKGLNLLGKHLPSKFSLSEPFVSCSFSSVLFSKQVKAANSSDVIETYIAYLYSALIHVPQIVLVPHSLRPNVKDPLVCDYALSLKVMEHIENYHPDILSSISLINEDLSCVDLKSIISNAYIHVGARYHSVVASLSSGVPTISMSWHPKYYDIMSMYDQSQYIHDIFDKDRGCKFSDILSTLAKSRPECIRNLRINQKLLSESVRRNALEWVFYAFEQ